MCKIVFLELESLGPLVDVSGFEKLGDVRFYKSSTEEEAKERIKDADIVIANKIKFNEDTLKDNSCVKLICLTATGTDNLDKNYLKKRGIIWHNAAGYSTVTVAQHTFALYFYLSEKIRTFDDFVKSGRYCDYPGFTWYGRIMDELYGKTWGIIGLGQIGKRVAQIAEAFGAKVIYYSTSGKNISGDHKRVGFDQILKESDVISVHAPLNDNTRGMMNADAFSKMKKSAYFINVARGGIVNDKDLYEALMNGELKGAALDVLSREPMEKTNPLLQIKDSEKLVITPHIGWASAEARDRLIKITYGQVEEFVRMMQGK